MTNNIVSMLLEGGLTTCGNLALENANQYTLESGANIIARESVQELHEIFEVAIVETNEAALAAYMEGNQDVMESATYGPVFEAAEKSVGQKILDFLRKLRDRVVAFFQNIFTKIMLAVNNYEKFYEKHKDELNKAKPVKDVPCMDWNDDRISTLAKNLKDAADTIKNIAKDACDEIKKIVAEENSAKRSFLTNKFNAGMDDAVNESAKAMGIARSAGAGELDMTQINKDMNLVFIKPEKVKKNIDGSYVANVLTKTKSAAKDVKEAQKAFNNAYNDAIKTVEAITKDMEKEKASGYSQYIHKTTSTMSKIQSLINVYASCGYRALIGRANEAKSLTKIIISGKVPEDKKKDDKK